MMRARLWSCTLFLLGAMGMVGAQTLRDPTLAPPDASASSTPVGSKSAKAPPSAMSVLVRDGKPFLMVGTRLYAPGQWLGQARIESISETEVSLREGKLLRKLALFQGIERHVVTPGAAGCPAPQKMEKAKASKKPRPGPASAASAPLALAPCAPVQP